jgi:hypothetical protein
MSFLNWFTRNPAVTPATHSLADTAAARAPQDKLQKTLSPPPVSHDPSLKNERLEYRELLYKVIHDSMIRAGVLAASYKFKVLSLDTRGLQYMIMMDLAHQAAGDAHRLTEIEAMMAQAAKARHGILVTAVYWRVTELVANNRSSQQTPSRPVSDKKLPDAQILQSLASPAPAATKSPAYEPLQQDEVDAFKRALASATPAVPAKVTGRVMTSGPRHIPPTEDFEDTQIAPSNEPASPLSVTQYGDLN